MASKTKKALLALNDGRAVMCQVSDRYLRYEEASSTPIQEGHPVMMYVMANNHGEKPDRNLCELVFTVEDLETLVAQLRADISRSS